MLTLLFSNCCSALNPDKYFIIEMLIWHLSQTVPWWRLDCIVAIVIFLRLYFTFNSSLNYKWILSMQRFRGPHTVERLYSAWKNSWVCAWVVNHILELNSVTLRRAQKPRGRLFRMYICGRTTIGTLHGALLANLVVHQSFCFLLYFDSCYIFL